MSFEREDRYFVFKRSDLLPHQAKGLEGLRATANEIRSLRGKPPLECVVVESDWPEYETVWDMIQGRVEGEAAELCPNCDAPLPQGCGGIFADDGNVCHGFGRDVPLGVMPLADVEAAERTHRDMVLENNRIAEQADAAESFAAGEGYYDAFQIMAFAMFREED